MNRLAKKFIYGIFYLAVLSLVAFGIYGSFFRPAPTCSDNIQNQGETDIDCDGPCISCEILNLPLPKIINEPKLLSVSSGESVLIAEILNSSRDYAALPFSYRFVVYGKTDEKINYFFGTDNIYPLEQKYVFVPVSSLKKNEVAGLDFEIIDKPNWQKMTNILEPELNLFDVQTNKNNEKVTVTGKIKNESPIIVSKLGILAVIFNKLGLEIFASETFEEKIGAFGEREFVVFFPKDPELISQIEPNLTKIILSIRQDL